MSEIDLNIQQPEEEERRILPDINYAPELIYRAQFHFKFFNI